MRMRACSKNQAVCGFPCACGLPCGVQLSGVWSLRAATRVGWKKRPKVLERSLHLREAYLEATGAVIVLTDRSLSILNQIDDIRKDRDVQWLFPPSAP